MIVRERRTRPAPWNVRKQSSAHKWTLPFIALEWIWEWVAFALSNWTFLEVLEYLGVALGDARLEQGEPEVRPQEEQDA